ncbi:hypothetical protein CORC01_11873 [Colletotrichum orchidophilum]|uniref:Uncharacterized protein n=1 Tax=Colletotrichum orchidophilum TaxID=1209926 RepID=A0A1G4AUK9_9PEZI|nr:uncharacterized protein CORC01_11873 [Colletotrichum orchidophilum]OHE92795.1 hypothetical protein CORC01_11873 [Colletotrichum orchidophilum]
MPRPSKASDLWLTPSAPPIRLDLDDKHRGHCPGPSGGEQKPRLTTVCDKSGPFGQWSPVLRCRAFSCRSTRDSDPFPLCWVPRRKVREYIVCLPKTSGCLQEMPKAYEARTFLAGTPGSRTSVAKLTGAVTVRPGANRLPASPTTPPSARSLQPNPFSHRFSHDTRSIRCPTLWKPRNGRKYHVFEPNGDTTMMATK